MPGLCSKNCCENSPRTPERGHAAITHQPPGVYPNTPGFLGESDISTGFRIHFCSLPSIRTRGRITSHNVLRTPAACPEVFLLRAPGGAPPGDSMRQQAAQSNQDTVVHRRESRPDPPHAGREAVPWYTRQSATAYQDTVRPSCLESRRKAKHRAPGLLPELEGQASRAGVRPAHPFLRLHCTGSKLSVVYQTTLNFVLPTPCSAHPFQ